MAGKLKSFNRLVSSLAILLVLGLSLFLLFYVGYGEARRTYPRFEIDKLAAQGDLVKTSVQSFLLANLPLEQFPGFANLAEPILQSDPSIAAIYATDPKGKVIFINTQGNTDYSLTEMTNGFGPSGLQIKEDPYNINENALFYQVSLGLRNRIEPLGAVNIILPRENTIKSINRSFVTVLIFGAAVLLIYVVYVIFKISRWGGSGEGNRWLPLSYAMIFFVMAVVVVIALIGLYTNGIQGKTQALTNSLSQRLNIPLGLGLNLDNFEGLDRTFKEYQKLNPDLSVVALTVDDKIIIHNDSSFVGKNWQDNGDNYEYAQALNPPAGNAVVHLGIPRSVVYGKLWRGVKNFVALFIASMLLSVVLFNLIRAFSRYRAQEGSTNPIARHAFQLSLMTPLYFVSIFGDALTKSFTPQYFDSLAVNVGLDRGWSATLFTTYFVCYALALVPSGRFADRVGFKPLFLIGSILNCTQLLMLAFIPNFYAMYAVQILAGFGQGIFFIVVQSFILKIARSSERTRSAGIIVFGYNGGTLSGLAIGALLVADPALGQQAVFIIGAIICVIVFFACLFLLPKKPQVLEEPFTPVVVATTAAKPIKKSFWGSFAKSFGDARFLKAVVLIAIPTRIVMIGLIVSNLPLVLARQNYLAEDIGQILMFYSGGVLISSYFISRLVDRTGKLGLVLFIGLIGSGIGVALVGLMGWQWSGIPFMATLVLLLGLGTLGLSHGFIQAPAITYVNNTVTADSLGRSSATSIYRLYERLGNISGPILISQLLIWGNQNTLVITWIGVGIIGFGLLFLIGVGRKPKQEQLVSVPNTTEANAVS
jgi:MFS family permease